MNVLRVKVAYGGGVYDADGIEYQGKLWLVPHWLDTPDGKWTMPARIVRFDHLQHSDVRGTTLGDYVLNRPMPKELFDVKTPRQPIAGHEFHELPEIYIPRA